MSSLQVMPTVRLFAPEHWGETERFKKFYSGSHNLEEHQKRAVSGVVNHYEKALTLRGLATKLKPGLDVDRAELERHGLRLPLMPMSFLQ